MKYLLIAIGTRGDVEPFLAIGEKLQNRGHQVVCAFPAQLGQLAKESNLDFIPLDKGFLEMIEGDLGKKVMGGGGGRIERLKAFFKLWRQSTTVNRNLLKEQNEIIEQVSPDYLIHSLKATMPLARSLKQKGKSILLSPIPCVVHPIKNKSSIGFRGRNLGKILNKLSYQLMTYASVKNLRVYLKKLYKQNTSQKSLEGIYKGEMAIYTVSPNLIDTSDLPSHVHFLGYTERDKEQHWNPEPEIVSFIENNPKFLFLTFGSMTNPDPAGKTMAFIKVCEKLSIPLIINTAGGGLEKIELDHKLAYYTTSIPYDWILPKAYAIVHHGGAGTTHLGVKYGCPSLIIPHIIDQYFWSNTLNELGVGPKGLSIRKIRGDRLLSLIQDLWTNENYLIKARELSAKMKGEDFEGEIINKLENPISALA